MSFFSALYQLLIGPLELFFEVIFSLADHVLASPALSIVALSLAMNFLVLPLYRRADELQARQRETELRLKPWVDHIRRAFSGDERFMILQTFYRQNGYRQTDALKGSVSLLLEVPFFIAAYRFLSGLEVLQGVRFGPIADLGQPDGLLRFGQIQGNLLPVLMTAINLLSAAIYMKGFPLKNKLQMIGMALVFLVLLYQSPAGLVLYWTLNNVFSLVKNIFYKLRHPGRVLRVLAALCGAGGLILVLFVRPVDSPRRLLIAAFACVALMLPLAVGLLRKNPAGAWKSPPEDKRLFVYSSLFLTVLTGLLIPSALIGASPDEFVFRGFYFSPFWYLLSSSLLAVGSFLIWLRIFYELAGEKGRGWMSLAVFSFAVMAAVDYLFFGTSYGNISSVLQYDTLPEIGVGYAIKNLLAIVAAVGLLLLLWKKKQGLARTLVLASVVAALGMSGLNIAKIPPALQNEGLRQHASTREEDWPHLTLSRDGKNVVVLMMDRAVGCYLPYLFTERPELQRQFAGFTFYPNTLSFGASTKEGSPALFGGYEYTPEEANKRTDKSIMDKHHEALKLMPLLFDEAGFRVTVFDPPFAGYRWYPDLSIYADCPTIDAYNTYGSIDGSQLSGPILEQYGEGFFGWQERNEKALLRNFFCYAVFRSAPVFLQSTLYNQGYYNAAEGLAEASERAGYAQAVESISVAKGRDPEFVSGYEVLPLMGRLTRLEDDIPGAFVMIANDATHSPCLLQTPDYLPASRVDNREYDEEHALRVGFSGWETLELTSYRQMSHYHVNMAALIQLGNWMDWLREQGVYDNTRIIIVADHGTQLGLREDMMFGEKWWEDIAQYNPLLLVKDFGSEDFSVDWTFMTNGDVPLLATEGLLSDPVNPFTGKPLSNEIKLLPTHSVMHSDAWDSVTGEEKTLPPGFWYVLNGDQIYDREAWSIDGYR